jgi:ABC-2 type transport system ATP-binding protein
LLPRFAGIPFPDAISLLRCDPVLTPSGDVCYDPDLFDGFQPFRFPDIGRVMESGMRPAAHPGEERFKPVSVVIETRELNKIYESSFGGQDVHALRDLNLAVNSGEIFAYLGPNGSGKTTTIKMLLGLIFPTSGEIEILGSKDIASSKVKRNIGYLPEGAYYPDFLKGEEILKYYGKMYGMSGKALDRRIDEVLEVVGMAFARRRMLRGYSKGMRQRIGLAQALISDPQIMILDEPTTGLDPIARKEIRDILAQLRDMGKTLLISSHELLEVEMISDRAGILFDGMLQTLGTIDELLSERDVTITVARPDDEALARLREKGLEQEDDVEGRLVLRVREGLSNYEALRICESESLNLLSVAPRRETLEELFVRVVGDAEEKRRSAS